jgi:phospholipid/cholesterol/gamma-HCH transport system substrate-binding protein
MRSTPRGAGRMLAVGGLTAVVLILVLLVFAGGGGAEYQLVFNDAGQLVKGDQVQVGGVPVGTIKNIVLTHDFKARVTIQVNSSLVPLHQGTSAQIRVPSLSGVANRYIALTPGPNNLPSFAAGSTLPTSATHGVTDIDQLFDIFNTKTIKSLQEVIQGSAQQYSGVGPSLNTATKYFSPALAATDHFFAELVRDQPTFTNFLVSSSRAVTTIAAHQSELTDLIGHADETFQAIGSQQSNFARSLRQLPVTVRQGNRTFAELPATLSALRKLVDVSKPGTKTLASFFARLHPLVSTATPVVNNAAQAINRPGANNDFTDIARALPAFAQALSTGSPDAVAALDQSVPITAFFGPYSPELEGTLRDFGQGAAYYDANGHYARVNPDFADFAVGAENNLTPVTPQQGLQGVQTGQLRRCPGAAIQLAADGSTPFTDNGLLGCDPTEVP